MALYPGAFEYLQPTEAQRKNMQVVRDAFTDLAETLIMNLPEGPDKTYVLRLLRTTAMWANVALTRQPDGSPRSD